MMITSAGNLLPNLRFLTRLESRDIHETLDREVKACIESSEKCSITLTVISKSNAENFFLLYPKEKVPGKALVYIKYDLQEWLKQKLIVPETMRPISDYTMYSIQKLENSRFKFTQISVESHSDFEGSQDFLTKCAVRGVVHAVYVGIAFACDIVDPPCPRELMALFLSVAIHAVITENEIENLSRVISSNIALLVCLDSSLFLLCKTINEVIA
jgi:hypothetical protein